MALDNPVYSVVSPLGWQTTKQKTLASRLDTIAGKTICEISNDTFRSNESFPIIRQLLQDRYPSARIIHWNKLPVMDVPTMNSQHKNEMLAKVKAALKELEADAVITQFGG